jgi:signal transduction histidine kinase
VTFAGAVDSQVKGELLDDVIACVREGLTNAAKYAQARRSAVDVAIESGSVTVRVSDDGGGLAPGEHTFSGLDNLRARAEQRGGSFEIKQPPAGGTELVWKAPLP